MSKMVSMATMAIAFYLGMSPDKVGEAIVLMLVSIWWKMDSKQQ